MASFQESSAFFRLQASKKSIHGSLVGLHSKPSPSTSSSLPRVKGILKSASSELDLVPTREVPQRQANSESVGGERERSRVKFVYHSPSDRQSSRNRLRQKQAAEEEVHRSRRSTSAAAGGPIHNRLVPDNLLGAQCVAPASFPTRARKSRSLLDISREVYGPERARTARTPSELENFLETQDYGQLRRLRTAYGVNWLQKMGTVDFFLIVDFLSGFFQPGLYEGAWEEESTPDMMCTLRKRTLGLAKSLGISDITNSHLKMPILKRTVFVKFLASILERAKEALRRQP